jgi:hypothetical protein
MKLLLKLRFSSLSQELPSLILAVLFRFGWFSCSQRLVGGRYHRGLIVPREIQSGTNSPPADVVINM